MTLQSNRLVPAASSVRTSVRIFQKHSTNAWTDTVAGNYWTAVIYFRARNGTFKRVPQRAQQGFEGTQGGMVCHPRLKSFESH